VGTRCCCRKPEPSRAPTSDLRTTRRVARPVLIRRIGNDLNFPLVHLKRVGRARLARSSCPPSQCRGSKTSISHDLNSRNEKRDAWRSHPRRRADTKDPCESSPIVAIDRFSRCRHVSNQPTTLRNPSSPSDETVIPVWGPQPQRRGIACTVCFGSLSGSHTIPNSSPQPRCLSTRP
jgi:hypothetical protein